jgi:hypothetical protein
MRPPTAAPLLLALAVALAGCSMDTGRPDGPTGTGDGGQPTVTAEPEPDGAVFQVAFRAGGEAALEVPFPHLDACLQPEHWMNGTAGVQGAVPELRDAGEGRTGRVLVLRAQGAGEVQWQSQVPLADHPRCETLRYDPWSVDPDPEGESVEVRASGDVAELTVLARWVRGGCGNATLYEGAPSGGGWSALAGRTIPAGCA